MRNLAAAVLMLLVVVPASAREFQRLASSPARFERLMSQVREAQLQPSAIINNRSTRVVVIPAAGNASGANATYFRSDVTLVNLNDEDQDVVVFWMPNGNPAGLVTFEATVEPGPPFTYVDFVGSTLELSGVGSLLFLPVDAGGNLDPNGALDAYSRIWSPAPNGAAGTFSQPFPGVDLFHLDGEYEALLLGLRHDASFRTNYGIVNLSDFDLPFEITIFNNDGVVVSEIPLTVRSGEMVLRALPAASYGNISILVSVTTDVPASSFEWTTFASSTDNFNGDGWVSIGSKPYSDDDIDTEQ